MRDAKDEPMAVVDRDHSLAGGPFTAGPTDWTGQSAQRVSRPSGSVGSSSQGGRLAGRSCGPHDGLRPMVVHRNGGGAARVSLSPLCRLGQFGPLGAVYLNRCGLTERTLYGGLYGAR